MSIQQAVDSHGDDDAAAVSAVPSSVMDGTMPDDDATLNTTTSSVGGRPGAVAVVGPGSRLRLFDAIEETEGDGGEDKMEVDEA